MVDLTADALAALLAREAGCEVGTLSPLGGGLDHVTYLADDALVVRVAREVTPDAAAALRREADLLEALVARTTVPAPEPVLVLPDHGLLAYRRLGGTPLLDAPRLDPGPLAAPLAQLLTELHTTPPDLAATLVDPDPYPMSAWHEEAVRDYHAVADHLDATARGRVESFLAAPVPPEPDRAVLCHNDLGAEHLLVDPATVRLTGVIDWSDAALTDPCRDFGRLQRDLGPGVLTDILSHYRPGLAATDLQRVGFYACCTLLEDLAHGVGAGDARYRDAALASLHRTFAAVR